MNYLSPSKPGSPAAGKRTRCKSNFQAEIWFGWVILLTAEFCLFAPFALHAQAPAASGTILTIAGNGTGGFSGDGGPATNASLNDPSGLAIGPDGTLYFADNGNFRFRAIHPATGIITTMAGNGQIGDFGGANGDGGPATNASFSSALTIAVDRARQALYCTDFAENRVRKVNLTNGLIANYAGIAGLFSSGFSGDGGPATSAQFFSPESVAVDGAGNLSIGDVLNFRIRQVHPVTGIVTTIAGNGNDFSAGDGGPATNASFTYIRRVAADRAGNIFVLDESSTNRIRRVDAATGIITTVAGGGASVPGTGPATSMNLTDLRDLAVSDDGKLFLANSTRVFVVELATGQLSPFAGDGIPGFSGDGSPALNARFANSIAGLALAPGGGLLISDAGNQRIRYVVPDSINLTNDSGQTAFHLPYANALTGDFTIANNSNLTNVNASSLTNVGGTISLNDNQSASTIDLSSLASVGGTISLNDNQSASTIDLSSLASVGGTISLNDNQSASTIDLSSLASVGETISLNDNQSASTIDLSSLASVGGTISLNDNQSASTIDLSSLASVGGTISLNDNQSAGVIDLSLLESVGGDITIASNAPDANVNLNSLTNYGCGPNEVTMTLDGGTFSLTNGLTLCSNATLAGSSTVNGSITNNGTIEPGKSPGRLNITGGLLLAASSRLRMELGGYTPGSEFDVVQIAGAVTLGGTLAVSLIHDFPGVMTNGASFTVLTAGSPLTGAFANVASGGTLTTTDGYARFTVLYAGENTVRLTGLEIVDTDTEGLPDWWEDQFSLDKTNAADAAPDLDGDGASNVNEFSARTDPGNPASSFRITQFARAGSNIEVTFPTVLGRHYSLEEATTLASWEPVPGSFPGTGNPLTLSIEPVAGDRYFVRARVGP